MRATTPFLKYEFAPYSPPVSGDAVRCGYKPRGADWLVFLFGSSVVTALRDWRAGRMVALPFFLRTLRSNMEPAWPAKSHDAPQQAPGLRVSSFASREMQRLHPSHAECNGEAKHQYFPLRAGAY
jgi:hypothetical protein